MVTLGNALKNAVAIFAELYTFLFVKTITLPVYCILPCG
jgi:hypothetical protein